MLEFRLDKGEILRDRLRQPITADQFVMWLAEESAENLIGKGIRAIRTESGDNLGLVFHYGAVPFLAGAQIGHGIRQLRRSLRYPLFQLALGLLERLYRLFSFGYIQADTPYITNAGGIPERKLYIEPGTASAIGVKNIYRTFCRLICCQYRQVSTTELLGQFLRPEFPVALSLPLLKSDPETFFIALAQIDMAPLLILDPGDSRAVIHEQVEPLFALL